MMSELLQLDELTREFPSRSGTVRAVNAVDLSIHAGESIGLVGESGSGKTTLARMVLGIEQPSAGRVLWRGAPLPLGNSRGARRTRREIQMVFQNPYSSIDPRFTVMRTVAEPLRTHTNLRGRELQARVDSLLDRVQLTSEYSDRYAHELSGGQLQRVAIARAIALEPSLIILDEPTSALDISIQASILRLLHELRREQNLTYLVISHDLGVIRSMCERVVVMYLGDVVDEAPVEKIFTDPERDPYTTQLLRSMPSVANIGKRARHADKADQTHSG